MMKLDLQDFDLPILLKKDRQNLVLETNNLATIVNTCKYAFQNNTLAVISGNPGYGIKTALSYIQSSMREGIFSSDITQKGLKGGLTDFFKKFGHDHSIIDWETIKTSDMITALNYKIKNSNSQNHLMILSGVPANPTIFYRDINCLHEEIVKSNLAGCILTITPSSVRKIQTKSLKNDHLKRFLNLIDDFVELSPPTKTEMRSICFESGILNEKIIDTLVANSENHTILDKRVNRLRRQVRALVSS